MLACLLLLAAAAQPPRPCVECHTDQAQQWRQSLHAESLRDPLYLAMRARARDEAGQAVADLDGEAAALRRLMEEMEDKARGTAAPKALGA